MLKVGLVTLGNLNHSIDFAFLEAWKSSLFRIEHVASAGQIPDANSTNWTYPDHQLAQLVGTISNVDFTVALINAPLQDNYYMRRVSNNVAILSFHEMAGILWITNFTIENYILRNIYELVVLYASNNKLFPNDCYTWAHQEIRRCLFDMNANKADIIFSLHKPILCPTCRARTLSKLIDPRFLATLDKELQRITKAPYHRLTEWVKRHPIWAIFATATSGLAINLLASVIFEIARSYL